MKRILVATDFSACASNAMEYALEMAGFLKFEVVTLHAIGSFEGIFNNTYNAMYIDEYYASKREALANWVKTFTGREKFSGASVSTFCEVGSLSAVIAKCAAAAPVEMLVMGTMGSSGIAGLFGSSASTMVEKTRIPTLIIPLETKFSTNPKITLATDFETGLSSQDISALSEILQGFQSNKLSVLNAIEGATWKKNEAGEQQLQSVMPMTNLEFHYIKEDSTTEAILKFIASSQTDILCVVKKLHGVIYRIFNTSVVNKIMSKSIKAILVLHE